MDVLQISTVTVDVSHPFAPRQGHGDDCAMHENCMMVGDATGEVGEVLP